MESMQKWLYFVFHVSDEMLKFKEVNVIKFLKLTYNSY